MDGVRRSGALPPVRPGNRPSQHRRWVLWIAAPAFLGIVAGVAAAALPWGRETLALALAISGIAWVLRIASDWFADQVGPQRGVAILGALLIGTWLMFAIMSPTSWRGLGLGSLGLARPEREPYSLPPAGSKTPLEGLARRDESMEPEPQPTGLLGLPSTASEPAAQPPAPPPTDGRRGATVATLRLSSGQTVTGEGIVLIASVRGDGRPVRGEVSFLVGDEIVAKQPLRVQGVASQTEYRLVGLSPGRYSFRVTYSGSRSFEASHSDAVPHRVVAR